MTRPIPARLLLTLSLAVAHLSCGSPTVVAGGSAYEPRIVIEGWLMPGQPVTGIRISRNFPLDANLRTLDLIPDDTRAALVEESSGRRLPLVFHAAPRFDDAYFEYPGSDLRIEPGRTYILDVTATVAGRALHAWAATTVPQAGFRIVGVSHEQLRYRPLDERGEPVNFEIEIERAPGTTFYVATVEPLSPGSDSFVYDNPFVDLRPDEVDRNLAEYSFDYGWIQNTPDGAGRSALRTFWYQMWFYGRYRIIVYAADDGYRSYLQTYRDVQEQDGNFHEARFAVEGDGIGVFGSVVADTVYVEVAR